MPLAHDQDAVAVLQQLWQVVADDDDPEIPFGQRLDDAVDLVLGADVDANGRAVQDKQFRLNGEAAAEQNTLLVAAGFIIGWLVCGLFWLKVRVSLVRAERKIKRLEHQIAPATDIPESSGVPVAKE